MCTSPIAMTPTRITTCGARLHPQDVERDDHHSGGNGRRASAATTARRPAPSCTTPWRLAVDSAGNLYIADSRTTASARSSNGVITTMAGNGTRRLQRRQRPGHQRTVDCPYGVAVDAAGNVYIADSGNDRIRVLTPSGPPARLRLLRPHSPLPLRAGISPSLSRPLRPAPGQFRACRTGSRSPAAPLQPVPATSRSMWPRIPAVRVRPPSLLRAFRLRSTQQVCVPVNSRRHQRRQQPSRRHLTRRDRGALRFRHGSRATREGRSGQQRFLRYATCQHQRVVQRHSRSHDLHVGHRRSPPSCRTGSPGPTRR